MESQGASAPGILTLTTSLSKPFMRLEKYPTLLQELERHVEVKTRPSTTEEVLFQTCFPSPIWVFFFFFQEAHPDYSDILKANIAFKNLVVCSYSLFELWPVKKRENIVIQKEMCVFDVWGCVCVTFHYQSSVIKQTRVNFHFFAVYSTFSVKLACYLYVH